MKQIHDFKEFGLSSWAIDNRTTIYLVTLLVVIVGLFSYYALPKENFPEIQIPTIYVGTVYPGTSPEDIENLVTRKIEKELKAIKGIKEIKSNSVQDYSVVVVEFETDVDLKEAKREVQEAVDKSKSELPTDLPSDPNVQDINLSEIPIMFVNVYGDMDLVTIKRYAEDIKDEIESMAEINRVDMAGALDREIQVNLDLYKMEIAGVSFTDLERAIGSENVIISAGQIEMDGIQRALRVNGEFESMKEIEDLVIKGVFNNSLYVRDVAEVVDGFKDRESYARLDGEPVITLNVIKKSGENLVEASEKIAAKIAQMEKEDLPSNLKVKISSDQSVTTKRSLRELINTIIIGFILVTVVLMFFMGLRDSLFVGLAVPLSSLIAFAVLPVLGFTMNMVVLFAFILALGIVVDNAIVVIENTYRIYNQEGLPIVPAAKKAAGEVIGPVFAGTLTTLAPFVPLAFWDGVIGEFMFFLPVTMIITLTASLLVAYVINPVFAVTFMRREKEHQPFNWKRALISLGVVGILAILSYLLISKTLGNTLIILLILSALYSFAIRPAIHFFQDRLIPWMIDLYRNLLEWTMRGNNPRWIMISMLLLFIVSFMAIGARQPKVVFFPEADPNFVYIYNSMPIGTDIEVTDSVTRVMEARVNEVLGENNPIVKSVVSNIAVGAGDPNDFSRNATPHKSRIQVEFVEYKERGEQSTSVILEEIRESLKGIPGSQIVVDKESNGPPTAKPVNIEISAERFDILIAEATKIRKYLDSLDIDGVEELKWDLEIGKPELTFDINRAKASELGISTAQVGMALRTAVFGKEASKFRVNEDEYPIQIRLAEKYRKDPNALINQKLTYRNMANGQIFQVPISAVADIRYDDASYGGINRLDLEKVVTISSNILTGYNPNEVVNVVKANMQDYLEKRGLPDGVKIDMSGEQEEQAETSEFLGKALMGSILLILLVLVTQFNSMPKVMIILFQIVLSMIGVLLGFALTRMDMSIVMVGVGIVSLAGVVVNNGIIMLDFIQIMKDRGYRTREAIIEGAATRYTPVILTASSTILGLVPMAVAMNINFETLLTDFEPQIFFGGDSAAFWGPLAWTIIFGLSFATMVTLIVVPVMYYLSYVNGIRIQRLLNRFRYR